MANRSNQPLHGVRWVLGGGQGVRWGSGVLGGGQSFLLTIGGEANRMRFMARPLRIQYADARYHIMSRGDRREAIFHDDKDRLEFLRTLGQTCLKTGWQVHAYCLISNHYHLVVETPQPNLAAGMKWLLGTYTQRFNRRH